MDLPPNILVIGAGPAGLMAAVAAASKGARTLVLEQMERPGLKLLVTGGGRCNLTNTASSEDFMAAFGRQGRFMSQALAAMDSPGLRQFFEHMGVPSVCPDGFEVYPASNKAADVLGALLARCKELGVEIRTRQTVTGIVIDRGPAGPAVRGVETPAGRFDADRVVVCCGGRSYPNLGARGGGYELARQAGHKIVELVPALVGLVCKEEALGECAGVSIPHARVWIDLPRAPKAGRSGAILFTHSGVSGPAVLDISGDVSALLATRKDVPLRIDLSPAEHKDAWLRRLDAWGHEHGTGTVRSLLAGHMPQAVADMICQTSLISPIAPMANIDRARRNLIVEHVKSLPATVTRTEGFDKAIVTRGGVELKQVDPRTLASRLVAGLHFAGEMLDLDGPCGGYNLQWAFSSGNLAGRSAAAAS